MLSLSPKLEAAFVCIATLGLVACSGLNDAESEGPRAELIYPLLDCDPLVPEFCGYPFPSNVYTVEDASTPTGRRVSFGEGLLQGNDSRPWDSSDGFSAGSTILTMIPGATSEGLPTVSRIEGSLLDDSPTLLLDVETGERVLHAAEVDVRAPDPSERSFVMLPGVRLRDDARYIVAIRNVKNDQGEVIAPSEGFAALRDGTESDEPAIQERRPLYEDIFAHLEEAGWARADLQAAWDFNTASDQNNTRALLHMRDEGMALAGEVPQYTIASVDTNYEPDRVAFRIHGTVRVPLYMDQDSAGAVLLRDDDGLPMVNPEQPWAEAPFHMLIPNSALESPAPIMQFGHGLFRSFDEIVERSAFRGFIDDYNYIIFGVDLIGMAAGDLAVVGAALIAGNIAGLQTMWERVLQGHLNQQIAMRAMIAGFSKDPEFGQYVDPTRAYYHGISQGGIGGAVYMALSNDVERGQLAVGGQPYGTILFRADEFDPFLEQIAPNYPDARQQQLIVALSQMPWDRGTPTGFSHRVLENRFANTIEKQVLLSAAIGDHSLPNFASHIMARTMGVKHLTTGFRDVYGLEPAASTSGESLYVEYDFGLPEVPDCNIPMQLCRDPHGRQPGLPEALRAMDEFFRTGNGVNPCTDGICAFPERGECTPEDTDEVSQAMCEL